MAIYKVETPKGIVEIEAPDDATDEQIIKFVQSQYKEPEKPKKSAFQQQAENDSFGQNLLAGIGGGMMSLYKGGKQALGLADQAEIDAHKEAMSGLSSTSGGWAGDMIGQTALAVPAAFIPGANTYAGAALLGGALGAAQPISEGESRLLNTGIGVLGGAVGKYAGDKAVKILGGNPEAGLTQAQARAAEKGRELGFKQTPGQSSGSPGLQKLEAALESDPFTSRPFDKIKDHNQKVMNKIASRAIGENSDSLDYTVLQQAHDRIGDVYKSVATKTKTGIDSDKVLNDIAAIEVDYEGLLPKDLIDDILVKKYMKLAENGQASGEQLQSLSSKLGKLSYKNMTSPMGDRDLGMAIGQVKDSVDDVLANTLDASQKEIFDQARRQYRNLMLLTQRNTALNPSDGNVKGNALAGLLQKKDRGGFMFGRNDSDLYNAARFAQAFQPIVGNSGTATRMAMDRPIMQRLLSPLTNTAASIYTSAPSRRLAEVGADGLLRLSDSRKDDIARLGLLSGLAAINQLQ